ncbi:MAG: macro domain-containing protein [bacterium]
MADEKQVNRSVIRLERCDVTDTDAECFVYYAQSDLKLGSGYGGAIAVRGGPSIQKILDKMGPLAPNECVITEAGEMKAKYIIHANGPKFQEEGTPDKLRATIVNALKLAEEKGIKRIAFPPMGYGFYGVPLNQSAELTLETIVSFLENQTCLEEVLVCLWDHHEYKPFQNKLESLK